MDEFGTNPDIDEKPPISLRDYLLQMNPLIVAAEGIESEEKWEVCSFFSIYVFCLH